MAGTERAARTSFTGQTGAVRYSPMQGLQIHLHLVQGYGGGGVGVGGGRWRKIAQGRPRAEAV